MGGGFSKFRRNNYKGLYEKEFRKDLKKKYTLEEKAKAMRALLSPPKEEVEEVIDGQQEEGNKQTNETNVG